MKRFVVVLAAALAQFAPQARLLESTAFASPNANSIFASPEQFRTEGSEEPMVVGKGYEGKRPQNSTKYPVVFVHGFLGWDQIFFLDYFYHVKKHLAKEGFDVHSTHVNPVASIEVRGPQLGKEIDRILAATGAEKVNIIAHSQGGLDSRFLIGNGYSTKIASVTSIATPHKGSPVPDFVFKFLGKNDNILYKAFEYIVAGLLGEGKFSGSELDLRGCLWNLSPTYMNEYFNPTYRDDPNIYAQSYAGISSLTGWSTGDMTDALLLPFVPAFGWGQKNDGLVTIPSAKWGRFRGVVSADHVNIIGQLFGFTSVRYQHVNFYKKIVYDLVDLGF